MLRGLFKIELGHLAGSVSVSKRLLILELWVPALQ